MDRFNGLNILVADDNKLNNQTLKQLLEISGATVSIAANGREALEWLRKSEKPFHLVLMDIQMPVLNGREATRIIRQDKKFSSIPVIAVTADNTPQDQWLCFQAGMDAHISKPLDYGKLCTQITNVLDGKHNQIESVTDSLDDAGDVESKQEILRRFANNSDLVVQMISLYQQEFQQLSSALEFDQPHDKLRETLHALRGLASTIGANAVGRSLIILSDIIKSSMQHKSELVAAKIDLIQAQRNCLNQLKSMFGIGKAFNQPQQRQADIFCLSVEQKQNLIKLLQLSDLSVIAKIEKVKNQHPKNSFIIELSKLVNHLKFKQAISLLSTNDAYNCQLSRPKGAE